MDAELVRQMYWVGKRQWPGVELGFEEFAAHCGRVFAPGEGTDVQAHAADLYLCCACACGVAEANRVFAREGGDVARAAIARIERDPDFVQEVLQELWHKLLVGPMAKVREYAGRGPWLAWVKVAAARMALDRVRARRGRPEAQLDASTEVAAAQASSPELALIRARHGSALQDALSRAVGGLSVQERNVLRMHVVGACTIDQIGRAYGVHRATAARWLERTRAKIHRAAHRELCVRYPEVTESQFQSLARALGAELELSLFEAAEPAD
jgi:RNA polymerase sigma-70 factor, ECF subfamily